MHAVAGVDPAGQHAPERTSSLRTLSSASDSYMYSVNI